MIETYEDALMRHCVEDARIVVMTAENRAAIRNLPALLGERFIDVGICEQTMIGMAAGLALRGRIPVVHALATFLTMRAFEFIRTDIGILRLNVKLIGAVPGFLSDGNGPTHQALEDIAIMRSIPGMRIVCPADGEELVQALPAILGTEGPVYVRYNARPAAVAHHAPFVMGEAEILSRGEDVTILTYGFLLEEAAGARAILEQQGFSVTLVNMRTLAPADVRVIMRAARFTRLLVIIEDHFRTGGLHSIVAETLLSVRDTCPTLALSLDGWFHPATLPVVLRHEGFHSTAIAARVARALVAQSEQTEGGKRWASRSR